MKHYGKRLLAMLLALALCLGLTEGAAYAQDGGAMYIRRATNEPVGMMGEDGTIIPADTTGADGAADTVSMDDVGLSGSDSVGSLLAADITEEQGRQEDLEYADNQITELEVSAEDCLAAVQYHTDEGISAEIVVAIYAEDSLEMAASGKAETAEEEGVVKLTLAPSDAMPEYFIAMAYLLDAATHIPLGSPFTTQLYTQEMQELQRSTVKDYEEQGAQVLNLDTDDTTNFMVYNDETTIIEEADGQDETNVLTDNGDGTYTVRNAGDSVTALQAGDSFSYNFEDGSVLLLKVKKIHLTEESDGTTTVLITEDDSAETEDYFDYIKIESDGADAKVEFDESQMEEGITFSEDSGVSTVALLEGDEKKTFSKTFDVDKEFDSTEGDYVNGSVTLTGSIGLSLTAHLKYLATPGIKAYVLLEGKYSFGPDLKMTGKLDVEFPIVPIKIILVHGVTLDLTPRFALNVTGEMKWSGKIKGTIGFSYDSERGWKSLNTKPTVDSELKATGSVSVQIKMDPKLVVINNNIGEAGMKTSIGVTMEAEADLVGTDAYKHDCDICYDGTLNFTLKVTAFVDLLDGKYKNDWPAADMKKKLKDFYYSTGHKKFGWGTCPYIRYPVTLQAVKKSGAAVSAARISIKDEKGKNVEVITGPETVKNPTTDADGELVVWLANGTYTIRADEEDYRGSKKVTVKSKKKTVKIEAEEVTYDVTVHVVDEETQEPLTDAVVAASGTGKEAETDESGTAVLSLMRGTYSLKATSEKYYSGTGSVTVNSSSDSAEITIALKRRLFGMVHLTVLDRDGNGVYGAKVSGEGLGDGEETITDFTGHTMFMMPVGTWTLYVRGENAYGQQVVTVEEGDSEANYFEITADDTHPLRLTVVDEAGNPVSGAKVTGPDLDGEVVTGADGMVEVPAVYGSYFQVYTNGLFGQDYVTFYSTPNGDGEYVYEPYYERTIIMHPATVFWTLNRGTLRVFGKGDMEACYVKGDYGNFGGFNGKDTYYPPWMAINYTRPVEHAIIEEGITSVGDFAFEHNFQEDDHLVSVEIADTVTRIGISAFDGGWNLKELKIPDGVTEIGRSAFVACAFTSISLPQGLTKIESKLFSGCSYLRSVGIPDSVTEINYDAFALCRSLERLEVPEGVVRIESGAFKEAGTEDCVFILPSTLEEIGISTFKNCHGDGIYFKGDKPKTNNTLYGKNSSVFEEACEGVTAHYPAGNSTWDGIESDPEFNYYWEEGEYYDEKDEEYKTESFWTPAWSPYDPATTDYSVLSMADPINAAELSLPADSSVPVAYDAELSLDLTDPDAEAVAAAPEAESADGQDADAQDTIGTEPESGSEDAVWAEGESETGDGFPAEDILAEEDTGVDAADMTDTVDISDAEAMADTKDITAAGTADAVGQSGDTLIVEERTLEVFAAGDATGGTSGQIHSFSGMPNTDYLFVEVVSAEAADLLAPDNLLYIAQGTTDETGAVSFDCRPRGGHGSTTATQQLFGPSDKVITEADVAIAEMTTNGEVQYPDVTVTYTDKEQKVLELAEDEDYTLSGDLRVVKAGDYTLTVTGIGEYSGTVTKSFTVKEQGGTVKPDDPTDPTDPTGPTDPSAGDHEHVWGPWETLYEADVFFGKLIMRRCSICKKSQTRYTGQPLPATISLSATSFPLKVKQSYKVKVSDLAKGDFVTSWTSSNPKVAKVSSSGKITGKKKGKATITVRLMSGLSRKITVKVQTGKVKTKKINVSSAKVMLTKGGTWKLAPAITPVTSQDKAKYTSSNKKVATVSKKGVIKAKKPGKAKITIRSGKKKKVVTVTVTN